MKHRFADLYDFEKYSVSATSNCLGTKVLVAQWANRYSSLGVDAVNINVNDLIAVNSTPVAVLLSFGKLHDTESRIALEIGEGCNEAASEADITASCSEVATLPDVLVSNFPERTFVLTGFGIGYVEKGSEILGQNIGDDDIVLGIRSNGLHCNGYSLARRCLIRFFDPDGKYERGDTIQATNSTIEDELLKPTYSYLPVVDSLRKSNIPISGLSNVTDLGVLSLLRLRGSKEIGFLLNRLPSANPIFDEIQSQSGVSLREMFRVFNMGIGFYIVLPNKYGDDALDLIERSGYEGHLVGEVRTDLLGLVLEYKDTRIVY